jgi:hypothetical protein
VIQLIDVMLQDRRLPDVLREGESVESWSERRKEILSFFSKQVFGRAPKSLPVQLTEDERFEKAFGGKAVYRKLRVSVTDNGETFSWPVDLLWPLRLKPKALLLHISFFGESSKYHAPHYLMELPVEEVVDRGYALAEFCYTDITSDDGNFLNGLAGFFNGNKRNPEDWGKIALWAWAASATRKACAVLPETAGIPVCVLGCSRLGKTALWAGATDEAFAAAFAINSGCGGVAINRGKTGETPQHIIDRFPYWFCENYHKYGNISSDQHPFDHHMLTACMAPRLFYSASASNDEWADPVSEFLSLKAASPVFRLLGERGLVHPDGLPIPQTAYNVGNPGMYYRLGEHGYCREDINGFIDFLDIHL